MIFLLKPTLLKHIKLFLKRNRGKVIAVTPPDHVAQTHPALWEELWNSLEKQAREILGWCKWSSWGILMEPVGKGADFTKSWGCRWEQGCGWGWSRDRLCHPSWYRTCLHLVHPVKLSFQEWSSLSEPSEFVWGFRWRSTQAFIPIYNETRNRSRKSGKLY